MKHSLSRVTTIFSLFSILFSLAFTVLCADIAIYGDTQTSDSIHRQVVRSIAARKPEIVFHTGDLSSRGSKQKHYDNFLAIAEPLVSSAAFYPARGNHDRSVELFTSNFPALEGRTYYTVEHDSLLYIILDTNLDLAPRSEQFAWLKQALAAEPPLPRIIIMHRPIFSSGFHGGDGVLALILPAVFAAGGVVAVFSGHDHDYERSEYKGISYFVSGGGGGNLRPGLHSNPYSKVFKRQHNYLIATRKGRSLIITAYGLADEVLDRSVLQLP